MLQSQCWVDVSDGQVLAMSNESIGDCLFRGISHQLQGQYTSWQLRAMAVAYMRDHFDQFHAQLTELGNWMVASGEVPIRLEGNDLPSAALLVLALPWTWGGAECLAALACALGRRIDVYQEGGEVLRFEPPNLSNCAAPVRVVHRYGGGERRTHYESVCGVRGFEVCCLSLSCVLYLLKYHSSLML